MEDTLLKNKILLFKSAAGLLSVLTVVALIVGYGALKQLRYVGVSESRTLSISAEGEVFAAPDVARINFSQTSEAKSVASAQEGVNTKVKPALDALKALGIEEKDIKTESYASYPKYDYGEPCAYGYCPQREQKLIGYEATQSVTIKVRDTDKVGEVLEALGKVGITNISGPEFGIDDEEKLREEARAKAIAQAEKKAEALADLLGVKIVRVVNFSESSGGFYYNFATMKEDSAAGSPARNAAPALPQGENKITTNVTVTYEIK